MSSQNSRFILYLKILDIRIWTNQMTRKFGHKSALSRAFQQALILASTSTLCRFGDRVGPRICTCNSHINIFVYLLKAWFQDVRTCQFYKRIEQRF